MKDQLQNTEWKVGEVKFFDDEKGFGFIQCWDDGIDYFVHISKIDSKQIYDQDYVVFKLVPSPKKTGTFEARNVSLASEFSRNPSYLKEQFSKYSVEKFRRNIVEALPLNDVIELLEKEFKSFNSIDSNEQYTAFDEAISCFYSILSNEPLSKIADIILMYVDTIATEDFKIEFWLKNVALVRGLSKNTQYLIEQFSKYSDEKFRENILKVLPSKEVIELLEKEITSFKKIESEKHYAEFHKVISIYSILDSNDTLREGIASIISAQVEQIASTDLKIKFWIDGILHDQPEDKLLKSYFETADDKERLIIFQGIENSLKMELLQQFLSIAPHQDVLDFVIEHLRELNGIPSYEDLKSKLYETEYWVDKNGYDFFEKVIEQIEETLNNKEKLSLFLSGYLDDISFDFILDSCLEISREEIQSVLKKEVLSKTEIYKIVDKLLTNEIESFWSNNKTIEEEITSSGDDSKRYDEQQIDPFKWILKIAKDLSESDHATIESVIIEKTPEWVHVNFWECGLIEEIPTNSVSSYLQITEDGQSQINEWLALRKITKDEIISILKSNIQSQGEIKNRHEYSILSYQLQTLMNFDIDVNLLEDIIPKCNTWFYRLALWLEGVSNKFNYEEYKTKLVFLSPDFQIRFLKKLFWLAHNNMFDLTIKKLDELTRIDFDIFSLNQQYHSDLPLDISVDIVVEAIKSFSENEKFLIDSELLSIVLKDLRLNKNHKFQIRELFEKCQGRSEADFKWERNGEVSKVPFGENQFYFAIQFRPGEHVLARNKWGEYERFVPNSNFHNLKETVKTLPGRKWNSDKEHWGVPSQYEDQVMHFAHENRFFIDFEGNNYTNNPHFAKLKKSEVPKGITFCEGRLANKKDNIFNREFWWCAGKACLNNCETIHAEEEWSEYTLLDFLTILGFNLDDGNKVGDRIEKGKYYQFISTINRFNRLLERMYCTECEHVLYPVEESNFAHYRVTKFHCENSECSQVHNEIYLHHCLNGKCNSIIDSRISKKCPNGLYICSNEQCGSCCSHNMMSRRLQNLEDAGGYIHNDLKKGVEHKLGHLERAKHFCYKCSESMNEISTDIFQCQSCSIQYDVSSNKFKRPHRHLTQNEEPQSINPLPGNFDESDDLY